MRVSKPAVFAAFVLTVALPSAPTSAEVAGPRQELTIATKAGPHEFDVEIADDDRSGRGLMFPPLDGRRRGHALRFRPRRAGDL
jgi:hypothetical protein